MFFILLLASAAFSIAACAAFFSIKGMAALFHGSYWQVIVMATSLEYGKLIAASYLKRSWDDCSKPLRTFLLFAVCVLMAITSAGIFGYLSNAYQASAMSVQTYTQQIDGLEEQKQFTRDKIEQLQQRLLTLNESRKIAETRITEKTSRTIASATIKSISESSQEAQDLMKDLDESQTALAGINKSINDIKIVMNQKTDIGSFAFVAKAFNTEIDIVVKWFIICIVCVFDPMAVGLVLALNEVIKIRQDEKRRKVTPVADVTEDVDYTVHRHIEQHVPVAEVPPAPIPETVQPTTKTLPVVNVPEPEPAPEIIPAAVPEPPIPEIVLPMEREPVVQGASNNAVVVLYPDEEARRKFAKFVTDPNKSQARPEQ